MKRDKFSKSVEARAKRRKRASIKHDRWMRRIGAMDANFVSCTYGWSMLIRYDEWRRSNADYLAKRPNLRYTERDDVEQTNQVEDVSGSTPD